MSNNEHFAELVKNLKSDGGFLHFSYIVEWYNKNYLTVDDSTVHNYVPVITRLLTSYCCDNEFMSLFQLVDKLINTGHMEAYNAKFVDLDETKNSDIKYRILAELCGKLVWTEWKKIPGHETITRINYEN